MNVSIAGGVFAKELCNKGGPIKKADWKANNGLPIGPRQRFSLLTCRLLRGAREAIGDNAAAGDVFPSSDEFNIRQNRILSSLLILGIVRRRTKTEPDGERHISSAERHVRQA